MTTTNRFVTIAEIERAKRAAGKDGEWLLGSTLRNAERCGDEPINRGLPRDKWRYIIATGRYGDELLRVIRKYGVD